MKGKIEHLRDSAAVSNRLKKSADSWTMYVTDAVRSESSSAANGKEASAVFDELIAHNPHRLVFRAFDGQTEVAWYGSAGLVATSGEHGECQVDEPVQRFVVGLNSPAWVRCFRQDERVVYEMLCHPAKLT